MPKYMKDYNIERPDSDFPDYDQCEREMYDTELEPEYFFEEDDEL